MDARLLDKLTRAEEDIVSAMLTSDGDLAACDFAWSSLLDEVSQASAFGNVNDATLSAADDLVARVATLVDCCLSLSSTPPPSFPALVLNTDPPPPLNGSSFIPDAHAWLLKNIANPYPSAEFKAFLAQRHNSPVSAVSSWFTNTRRRIGWRALCRDFFRNCRADAVDAAHRVLVKEDSDHQLGSEVIHAFVTMKIAAEELCASSMRNTLTGDLEVVVKDLLPKDESLARRDALPESGKMGCLRVPDEYMREPSTCTREGATSQKLPTMQKNPDLQHSSCLGSSLTEENEEDPSLLAGRKWRPLPSEPAHVGGSKPMKPPRASSSSPSAGEQSPSTSAQDLLENGYLDHSSHSIRETQSLAYVTNPRKRRLSDPHFTEVSKRPRDSVVGSHLHPLPDPHPLSVVESGQAIDEWFTGNLDALFALPPPAEVAEPDFSTQWEFDLFNNYSLPENSQEAVTPPIPDYGISSSSDLTALDDLLQCFPSDGFVAPPQIMHTPQSTPAACTVSQSLPILPDLSQSIDWTTLFNGCFESTSDSIFSQLFFNSALPEIDLSALHVPQAWGTAVS